MMAGHSAVAVWSQGLNFSGFVDNKEISVPIGNTADTVSPMGLLLAALAGCTGMDVISILEKKRQQVTHFEVAVEGDQDAEHPRVYRQVRLVYRVTGVNIDESAVARAVELSVTKYCPVHETVKQLAQVEHRYEIIATS